MALTDYVIMPGTDYQNICDSVRTITGKTELLKSGEISPELNTIQFGEDITAAADFSNGNMVLGYEDKFVKTVTVQKPETLIPENIAKDVDIAGVIGTLAAGGGDFEGDIFKYLFCTVDAENMEIIVNRVLYDQLYADTGSYDINIPDKFGTLTVVLNSEGIE